MHDTEYIEHSIRIQRATQRRKLNRRYKKLDAHTVLVKSPLKDGRLAKYLLVRGDERRTGDFGSLMEYAKKFQVCEKNDAEYATDYENRYGYEHKIVQTWKNKEEADKNRRLAAIYNRICEGHEYPIEVVREVQKYIRNKNQYLQKLIDEKKAQSYMAFSEKEWVARLESQLRDESVFLQAKLESNIWGEPNPLDIFIEEAV